MQSVLNCGLRIDDDGEHYISEGDAHTEPVTYMHCSTVDGFPVLDPNKGEFDPPQGKVGAVIDLGEIDQDEDESDEDAVESVIEYIRTNGL